MQIFVGNLPLKVTDAELLAMFQPFGNVKTAAIGVDKKTGEPAGYGIVEMPVKSEARAAVDGLRGKDMNGSPLRVRIMKPDDPFHNLGQAGMKGARAPRGAGGVRAGGGGAIRSGGGQRGS